MVVQLLRDELERHLQADTQLTATFSVWLLADGSIQRVEIVPSCDVAADHALRQALDETARQFKLPQPPAVALAQPMRFKLSLRTPS